MTIPLAEATTLPDLAGALCLGRSHRAATARVGRDPARGTMSATPWPQLGGRMVDIGSGRSEPAAHIALSTPYYRVTGGARFCSMRPILGSHTLRYDPPNAIAIEFCKPQVAIRSAGDIRRAALGARKEEIAYLP